MTVGPAAGDGLGFKVTPDNVLGAYAVLKGEVDRLNKSVYEFRRALSAGMGKCGGDPVSQDAAVAFTEACTHLAEKCAAEVRSLDARAEQVAQTARSYGMAEDQIRGAFQR